ncbi:hypothetical protein C8J56DRAFT_248734 [Mycena floridula]|nr:hypothetical protein C8J56DRAFT_248734 [Mycena floridula]
MNNHSALLTSLDKVITYVTSMDRSVAQADFFGDLKSLRTLLWFNGHSFNPEDAMIHGLGHKLSSIAASLETQMEESDTKVVWPFTPQDEQYFLEAITHLGSVLNTAQSQLQSTRVHTDTIAVATESSTEYSHPAATVGMYMSYANSTISGNVGGSVFSNNRIHVAADPNVGYGVGHLVRSANGKCLPVVSHYCE